MELPFSQSCENNKDPILEVIRRHFTSDMTILEIGSGTGQHAVYFAEQLPHVTWQTSDQDPNYLGGLTARIKQTAPQNVKLPVILNVCDEPWPVQEFDSVFTANTLHIMSWESVQVFIQRLGKLLKPNGLFCCYGPFNYQGKFTSESNARFDLWLKDRDPVSGIRDFEAIERLATDVQIQLIEDVAMPANNRLLVWKKST